MRNESATLSSNIAYHFNSCIVS